MHLTEKSMSNRTILYCLAIVGMISGVLWFGVQNSPTHASVNTGAATAPEAVFPADAGTLGAIPDGVGTLQTDGPPRNVTFTVSGLSGVPTGIEVGMTFGGPIHSYVGDVTAVLIAPNGASHTLFGYTGATVANSFGDSSDLAGPYTFKDTAAAPPSGGWWQAATAATGTTAIATGEYRSTARGGAGAVNPQPPTVIDAAFAGVSNPNGTWTLRLTDGATADTGAISAASLTIVGGATPTPTPANVQHVVDYDGNGRTDFSVVRNTGGGAGGAITWFNLLNGPNTVQAPQWGISTDTFVPEDYDGDGKTDVAVWRSGTQGVFYILQSATSTVRIENFGQSGDDPTVVGDYDGDNKADIAVFRDSDVSGSQTVWYYRGSLTPGNITFVPWGQSGDYPAPGDYDGDGKNDFVVQRPQGSNPSIYYTRFATGSTTTYAFGTSSDVIVPGDYDGDGKTDLAVVRGVAGAIQWYVRRSTDFGVSFYQWGDSNVDFPTQGDYDGDGKTDLAVWRPTTGVFYVLTQNNTTFGVAWGQSGDYPVANFNTH